MSWKKVKLGDVCIIEKGSTGILKAIPGQYPMVVTSEERKSHNEFQFDDDAVIIPLVSGTGHGHASIKRIHFQQGKFALGSILCAVIPKDKKKLNAEYLYRFLHLNKENELVARMKGMANVTLPMKEIALIEIPLPTIKEQFEFVEMYKDLETKSDLLSVELTHQLSLVKKLRQQLLQDAVQGKLVEQNKKDEPASELLKKIKEEKERLLFEKLIKIGKLQEAELQADIYFPIPQNWQWCKLDELCTNITDGTHQTPIYTASGKPFISAQHVKPFKFTPDERKYISEEAYTVCIKNKKPEVGDILVTRVGAIGEAAIIEYELEFAFYVSLALIQPLKEFVNAKFIELVINSPYGNQYSKRNVSSKGSSAGNFNLGRIRSFLIPLPPLAEQNRIVQKLDELMQYCNDLDASIKESAAQNEKLLQQVLREALRKEPVKV